MLTLTEDKEENEKRRKYFGVHDIKTPTPEQKEYMEKNKCKLQIVRV